MATDKILIVEDEASLARVIEGYLKHLGYEVTGKVDNGQDALRVAAETRPALALMDIEIQGAMNGFEVAEQFRREYDIPVVFLTGQADDQTLERVRKSESFGYVLKPFRPEELKAGIELALIRHGHEKHLKQTEQTFSAAIKSAGDGILLTDQTGAISFLNPAAERLTGWPLRRARGQPLATVFKVLGDDEATKRMLENAERGAFLYEVVLGTATGQELPVEVDASVVKDEVHGALGSALVFRDITDRKRFEAQLKKSHEELRMLAGHLESAREAERSRIAREIHDEFGQLLTGFKFDLVWLEKKLSAQPETAREALLEKVRSMGELLHGMVHSVRRIAAELRPGILDDLGLAAAVEWQAEEFQKRTSIQASVSAELSDGVVPRDVATALFRILQESLTNVARHAAAKNVEVSLREEAGEYLLEVTDDGRGITEAEINKPGAFGLLGMRERVLPLRGRCEIRGTPGQGTRVSVSVPSNGVAKTGGEA